MGFWVDEEYEELKSKDPSPCVAPYKLSKIRKKPLVLRDAHAGGFFRFAPVVSSDVCVSVVCMQYESQVENVCKAGFLLRMDDKIM